MAEKRQVGDEEYREALENLDNKKIIEYVLNGYKNALTLEERKSCGLIALWKALQYYNPSYGQKFTTSLYRLVKWECGRVLQKRNRKTLKHTKNYEQFKKRKSFSFEKLIDSKYQVEQSEDESANAEKLLYLKEKMAGLSKKNREIIELYYFQKMTLRQIGKSYEISREMAFRRLKKAMTKLKGLACADHEETLVDEETTLVGSV